MPHLHTIRCVFRNNRLSVTGSLLIKWQRTFGVYRRSECLSSFVKDVEVQIFCGLHFSAHRHRRSTSCDTQNSLIVARLVARRKDCPQIVVKHDADHSVNLKPQAVGKRSCCLSMILKDINRAVTSQPASNGYHVMEGIRNAGEVKTMTMSLGKSNRYDY